MSITQTLGQFVDWLGKDHHDAKAFYCPKEQQDYELQRQQQRAEQDSQWPIG